MTLAFVVPGDPVPLPRPRVVRGHAFTPERAQRFKATVAACARLAGAQPIAGSVRVTLRFFRASAHACDLDNLVKAVLDGLNGVAFHDDRQVIAISATKAIDGATPRTTVEVEELAVASAPRPRRAAPRDDAEARRRTELARLLPPHRRADLFTRRLQRSVRRPA